MLNTAKNDVDNAPWMAVCPGLAIFLLVLAFNLLGDGLRDALDPRPDGLEFRGGKPQLLSMMQADTPLRLPARLHALAAMASLLERLDHQPASRSGASAAQYRGVVHQINTLLGEADPGPALDALLAAAPATAELYENIQYAYAGLCRSPQDAALQAEVAAKKVLTKAASKA